MNSEGSGSEVGSGFARGFPPCLPGPSLNEHGKGADRSRRPSEMEKEVRP